jgi:hypothetical protein
MNNNFIIFSRTSNVIFRFILIENDLHLCHFLEQYLTFTFTFQYFFVFHLIDHL